jgi:hypothetical protein
MMNNDRILRTLTRELRKEDKIKHMTWSFWLMVAGLVFLPWIWAIASVFMIGLAKEVWDERYGSGFCFYDMLGNCIGMAGALLLGLPLLWMFGL